MLLSLISAVADSGTPADYAVIACGDLDAPEVLKKLKYMSLMVPAGATPEKPLWAVICTGSFFAIFFEVLTETTPICFFLRISPKKYSLHCT